MQSTDSSTPKKARRSKTSGGSAAKNKSKSNGKSASAAAKAKATPKPKAKAKSPAPKAGPKVANNEIGGLAPVDFRPLRPVPTVDASELAGIIARARRAQETWAARSLNHRINALRRIAKRMLDKRGEIIEILRD